MQFLENVLSAAYLYVSPFTLFLSIWLSMRVFDWINSICCLYISIFVFALYIRVCRYTFILFISVSLYRYLIVAYYCDLGKLDLLVSVKNASESSFHQNLPEIINNFYMHLYHTQTHDNGTIAKLQVRELLNQRYVNHYITKHHG